MQILKPSNAPRGSGHRDPTAMVSQAVCCAIALWLTLDVSSLLAQEPWGDARMPVTEGVLLWLDASSQAELADPPVGAAGLQDGVNLSVFRDGSGNGLDLAQADAESQPVLRKLQSHAFVSYDGLNDFMMRADVNRQLNAFSAFVYVAPASNLGWFRGILSARATARNDYQTGFNIDLGGAATNTLQVVNVEGAGFSGQRNLLGDKTHPFREFHLLEVRASADTVALFVDGELTGQRERGDGQPDFALEEIGLGCRLLGDQPTLSGNFDGHIAEVLLFDRRISDDESTRITEYFGEKYAGIDAATAELAGSGARRLQLVENPPDVQMFLPGFTVGKLPVELTNINNVMYRSDGVLVALAYDGNVYLLRDHDGDGIEETATLFWENNGRITGPIGMALTPDAYRHGRGLFVTSKGKCSLIVDTDEDDRADQEIIVAEGWQPLGHGVDALGVAVDPSDHSVWFGLGTKNFTDAYLMNEGVSTYKLSDERGTILRVAPDFKSREIICTGIRFPVSLRFNVDGELFCTDQEGATWLPNGNPYDELLHIQKGRHYGFPPQHPKWLPGVIDEPSVYDYRPQHQSTCGLNFNEPVQPNGAIFGPPHWRHDAFVVGYSRGKLYRTQLIQTPTGYVAQNQLIGSAQMLPADCCVSPEGDLVVAVHSGGPDWGSGPAGKGELYKIRYALPQLPIPVSVWAASPHQVRVAFDRPLSPAQLSGLSKGIEIEHGAAVRAGDRFESMRPGYAVVQQQMTAARKELPVTGVQVTPDRRTLVIDTAAHTSDDHYAITLAGLGREQPAAPMPAAPKPDASQSDVEGKPTSGGVLAQFAETDLDYALHGVTAVVEADDAVVWSGWLPHAASQVASAFTTGSVEHEAFQQSLKRAKRLRLSTQLDLERMLQPDIQPGSKLDHEYSAETITVVFQSPATMTIDCPDGTVSEAVDSEGRATVEVVFEGGLHPVEISLEGHDLERGDRVSELSLDVSWYTARDPRPRAFPLRRFVLPWVNRSAAEAESQQQLATLPAELEGGSWGRGRKVFFGATANCSKCHRLHDQGGNVGPDLSNLRHRDYQSVLRDIVDPSFAINPDHLSYTVLLTDGRVLSGLVAHENGKIVIGNEKGERIPFDADEVEEMSPSTESIMPKGIDQQLGPEVMRDLLTFLIGPGPSMPDDRPGRPALRTQAEIDELLARAAEVSEEPKPLHIVLVAGEKDHGPGEHDYPAWQRAWAELFRAAEHVTVTTAMDFPDSADLETADALVFYQKGKWNAQRSAAVDAFLKRGGGVTYIHYAVDGEGDPEGFAERIGLAWQGGRSRFRHGPLDLVFAATHPIARNLSRLKLEDESYWNLLGDPSRITLLASGREENEQQPLIWCREQSKGRVFVSIPGHYSWTFDDPLFRVVLLRGIAWSVGEPVDRFNELVTLGIK